ncbi:MAG: hypothetical protein J6S06_01230 [Alphaproteobacteria bacterium]|nr:hypothetical protein [Alphaproteobacteria bacterium]
MKIKHIAFLSVSLLMSVQAMGATTPVVSDAIKEAWGFARQEAGGPWNTVLAGGTGGADKDAMDYSGVVVQGTDVNKRKNKDERAFVALIARTIVEHGGYFCPTQMQCAQSRDNSKNRTKHAYTTYYNPAGFSDSKCKWLCEKGYTGNGCQPQAYSKASQTSPSISGMKTGVSLNKGHADKNPNKEGEVTVFDTWVHASTKHEADALLGVVAYGEHGLIAAPVAFFCSHNGKVRGSFPVTYVQKISRMTGLEKLLCEPGYLPNEHNTDCVVDETDYSIDPETGETFVEQTKWCDGFPGAKYDMEKHFRKEEAGCVKYFCTELGYAFMREGVMDCVECTTDKKNGIHPDTGVCVHCETGTVFDKESGNCVSAVQISKWDMMYGCGKTRSSYEQKDLYTQCWTMGSPDELIKCVREAEGTDCPVGGTPRGTTAQYTPGVAGIQTKVLSQKWANPVVADPSSWWGNQKTDGTTTGTGTKGTNNGTNSGGNNTGGTSGGGAGGVLGGEFIGAPVGDGWGREKIVPGVQQAYKIAY